MPAPNGVADRASLAVDDDGDDRFCPCGYNLRGLPASRRCPECGTPPGPPAGGSLWESDVEWLGRLRIGVVLILGHWFAFAPATIAFVPLANAQHPCMDLVWLFPQAVLVAGVWWLMSPEPGVRRDRRDLSRGMHTRRLALGWLVLTTLRAMIDVVYRYRHVHPRFDVNTARMDVATGVCCAAWTALVAMHLSSLGGRANNGWLTYGGAAVWASIAWGVMGEGLWQLCYTAGMYPWPATDIRDSSAFAFFIGSVLTVGFLTAYWIAINLAIDGTNLELKRVNPNRRRSRDAAADPSRRISAARRLHSGPCSTANSDSRS
jgi:hypothetical protein